MSGHNNLAEVKTNMQKPLILIVDDTPLNIQVLAETLNQDYRIRVALNGKQALAMMQGGEDLPDLVLLDIMMPDMDGYEVCQHIKSNSVTSNIPIIFVTAKTDARDEERGLNIGALDYIHKPFHPSIVKARIRNHINLKLKSELLETMALMDALTNLPNRRRFDEIFELEWRRAARSGKPVATIMADIDYFKRYNDHYGHGIGDDCLKKVSAALKGCVLRPADLVARYGGEEFVAVLPETNGEDACMVAARFCSSVEAMNIPHSASEVSQWVTLSVGFASCVPCIEKEFSELLSMADRSLYRAKKSGRNRISGHSE